MKTVQKIKKEILKKYLDKSSFIMNLGPSGTPEDGDGGDGLSRNGLFYQLNHFNNLSNINDSKRFYSALNNCRLEKGHYTRHAKTPWKDIWTVSRDQYLDMWGGLDGLIQDITNYPALETFLEDSWEWVKIKNLRITKDILGPHHLSVIYRARKKLYALPIVWLYDSFLLITSIINGSKP